MMALIPRFFNIRLFLCLFSTSKSALFRSQMPAFNVVYAFVMLNLSFTGEKWSSNVFLLLPFCFVILVKADISTLYRKCRFCAIFRTKPRFRDEHGNSGEVKSLF